MIVDLSNKPLPLSFIYEMGLAYGIAYNNGSGSIELLDVGPFTCFGMANRYMKDECSKDPVLLGTSLFVVGLEVKLV